MTTRSNIDRAQAIALSMHSWNNRPEDWQRLQDCVERLGKRAPKEARATLDAYYARRNALPNPFSV
jgi:hypothetical protein